MEYKFSKGFDNVVIFDRFFNNLSDTYYFESTYDVEGSIHSNEKFLKNYMIRCLLIIKVKSIAIKDTFYLGVKAKSTN
ncbi:hypothetical protein [Gemelliphila palaticanis]|uniref:Uncharacterized protein n=1 Tax=Gemelliphila palaticanis TaxID=81950 RepID=A0ABX2SXL0_9BACL|nr:hypothetical protein [Gemella palaticanis]MBF0714757.1 hypothetical protein [Gemella palaticanis]NYS46687.1 hypothetical protein [Gemella palaticanis]